MYSEHETKRRGEERWRLIGVCSAAVMLAVLLAGGVTQASSAADARTDVRRTLTVNYYPGLLLSYPILVADELGFFRQQGLNVNLVPIDTGSAAVAAVANGSVDAIGFTGNGVMVANGRGAGLRLVVGTIATQTIVILAQKGLGQPMPYPANIRAMKGHTVGISAFGADPHLVAQTVLQEAGLTDRDVTFLPLGGVTSVIAAFGAKRVDYVLTVEPAATLLTKRLKLGVIAMDLRIKRSNSVFTPWIGNAMWARSSVLVSKAEHFKRFRAAITKSILYIRDPANQAKLITIFRDRVANFPRTFVGNLLIANRSTWSAQVTCAQVANVSRWALSTGLLTQEQLTPCSEFLWQPPR